MPKLEASAQNQKLKEGLFDLISNVILFEVEKSGGQEFHFRFAMEDTPSFKNLDAGRRRRSCKELYVDYFFRRQDEFWMQEAMQKLPALKRVTNMLICGEDLGLVPACVPEVMTRPRLVEPGNPAHAQGTGPGIFPSGGCALFERGHAVARTT